MATRRIVEVLRGDGRGWARAHFDRHGTGQDGSGDYRQRKGDDEGSEHMEA